MRPHLPLLAEVPGGGVIACEVHGVEPDAVTVDALARLQLAGRPPRLPCPAAHASRELRELVAFMGLTDVLPVARNGLAVEAGRPKSGNSVSVSRKNVSSTILPSSTSSTCSAHGS